MRQLSIEEVEPSGAVSHVVFDDRSWLMSYKDLQSALADAVMLGMIDDCAELLAQYAAEPLEWELCVTLPDFFDDAILEHNGWTQEAIASRVLKRGSISESLLTLRVR